MSRQTPTCGHCTIYRSSSRSIGGSSSRSSGGGGSRSSRSSGGSIEVVAVVGKLPHVDI